MITKFEELIKRAQEGENQAREEIIMENMGLVYSVVRRFSHRGLELEDLVQIGTIGLIKAVNRFDSSFEVCFSTYAIPMIVGEIKRVLRDSGSIRVSRSLKERAYIVMKEKERFTNEYGREPQIKELADGLKLTEEEIVECLDAVVSPISLSEAIQGDGDDTWSLEDKVKDKKETEERWLNKLALEDAMDNLNEREKRVIYMKYYLGRTQGEIAYQINLSQAQVSRIEKSALHTMKEYLYE